MSALSSSAQTLLFKAYIAQLLLLIHVNLYFSGEECLGSARIERLGPTHYAMNVNNCKSDLEMKRKEAISLHSDKKKKKRRRVKDYRQFKPQS